MNPGNGTETLFVQGLVRLLLGRNQMNPGNGTETYFAKFVDCAGNPGEGVAIK